MFVPVVAFLKKLYRSREAGVCNINARPLRVISQSAESSPPAHLHRCAQGPPTFSQINRSSLIFASQDKTGKLTPLSNYKGKVLLIVNVASECGFTQANYTVPSAIPASDND